MRIFFSMFFVALLLSACNAKQETIKSEASPEIWQVQPQTAISFTSIKNETAPVAGKFTDVTGTVDLARFPELAGSIQVQITSLNTGNPGRDLNITSYFFEADQAENAVAEFLPTRFQGATDAVLGETPIEGRLEGTLKLHGEELQISLPVKIAKTGTALRVESTEAANLSIEGLDMQAQKGKLLEVCGHQSVEDAVAIKLNATFTR